MDIRAYNRNVRQSARKVRLLADLIRGMDSSRALNQLRSSARVARIPLEKVLKSALANAEHNFHINSEDTFIKTVMVDQGTPLKRWRARAFGRAAPIHKHSCHITLVLNEKPGARKAVPKPSSEEQKPLDTGLVVTENAPHPSGEHGEQIAAQAAEEYVKEIVDTARTGRHEFDQNNNRETKKQKGFLKKVFNRKSG